MIQDYLSDKDLRQGLLDIGLEIHGTFIRPQLKALLKIALGGICVDCGESRLTFLQIDHVRPVSEGGLNNVISGGTDTFSDGMVAGRRLRGKTN